jgi:uncharacterized membrane protein YkoI
MLMRKSIHLLAAVAALGLASGAIASSKPATKATAAPSAHASATASEHASAKAAKPKAAKPRYSMSQARAIAHKTAPGRIIKTAMADGRYVFDVKQKNNVEEVAVDANTGKVVENKSEGKTDRDKGKKE